jgi:hypothetical protein
MAIGGKILRDILAHPTSTSLMGGSENSVSTEPQAGGSNVTGVDVVVAPTTELFKWAVPKGWAALRAWLRGKRLLIIGQARAGKTTFRKYLQWGLFDDEHDSVVTPELEASERFSIDVGRNASLQWFISTAIDSPGQVGPVEHANVAYEQNPDVIIIVLDLTTPLDGEPDRASGAWLQTFCRRFEVKWRVNNKRKRNRLTSLMVLTSKFDKVPAADSETRKMRYREILNNELREGRGKMRGDIKIVECVMVRTMHQRKFLDRAIAELAQDVRQ